MEKTNLKYLAAQVLAADPKELADALVSVIETKNALKQIETGERGGVYYTPEALVGYGGWLANLWEETKAKLKVSHLDMGGFTLKRFKGEDYVKLVGVCPGDECFRLVYEIVGMRAKDGFCAFKATKDGETIFSVTGHGFARLEKTAISALRRWIGEGRRMHLRIASAAQPTEGGEV